MSVSSTINKRKVVVPNTCGGCDATWTAAGIAHCSGCHRTFSGAALFDRHRSLAGEHGTCADPLHIRDRDGQPICELRDGAWRYPEMTDEEKLARFGTRGAA